MEECPECGFVHDGYEPCDLGFSDEDFPIFHEDI
jgi:hypothetical protein